MNNFTKVALGTITTLATVAPGAMAGYQVEGYHLMDGSDFGPQNEVVATQIVNSLNDLDVPVFDGSKNNLEACVPNKDGSRTLGYFVPSQNYMVVCTDGIGQDMQMETLVHESVHVIQDARDGIDNDTLVGPEGTYYKEVVSALPNYKAHTIETLYDREDWAIEAEAFLFETEGQVVADELATWVF